MIIFLTAILLLCLSIVFLHSVKVNKDRIEENRQIEVENETLVSINQDLKKQQNELIEIVNTLSESQEKMRQSSERLAQEQFQAKYDSLMNQLARDYESAAAAYQSQIDTLAKKQSIEKAKLQDIENKQLAYLEAEKRKKEMEEKQDYYRLMISEVDLQDIKMLRDLQNHFFHKESIDKLIWEAYYKSAYDTLMARLFGPRTKICGIYKITDITTDQAYVGQSIDVKERFRQHIKASLTYGVSTNKLYQTMQKSGQNNFTFEILEEVDRSKLNEREAYWIDFYKTKDFGLNSTKGNS